MEKKCSSMDMDKKIHEWSIATAWDLSSTVTHEGSFQSGTEINSSNYGEVTWNKDGTKLFYPRSCQLKILLSILFQHHFHLQM